MNVRQHFFLAGSFAFVALISGCATANPDATASPNTAAATLSGPRPLVIAATGDGPRGPEDWTLLPQYFAAEKADGRARYLFHTGDLCKGSQMFDADYSARVAALYRQSSIPVLFVVGDNEWNDQNDPWAAWPRWEKDFMRFHEAYPGAPTLARQGSNPENFAWVEDGVLIIGVNLVGGFMHDVEEWDYRHRANVEWVSDNLKRHGNDAYAVVVVGQAHPKSKHEDFVVPFAKTVAAFEKPVLYLHGDGHHWQLEEGWRAPNMTRIQVDQVTKSRPVHIIVSPVQTGSPFSYDRHGAGEKEEEGKQ
jgi:hypothetical protein